MAGRRIDRPAAERRLFDALKGGNTIRASAAYAGISEDTVYTWCKVASFAALIKDAEAQAEVRNVALIQQAAKDGSWQAAAWWLERRKHEDWKKRSDINLAGDPDQIRAAIEAELAALEARRSTGDAALSAETERSL